MDWRTIWHIMLAIFIYNRISSIFYFVSNIVVQARENIDRKEKESFSDKLKKKRDEEIY